MNASNALRKGISEKPNKQEKAILKERGVNMKNRKEVLAETAKLREENKQPEVVKPTQEELLTQILEEVKKQNKDKE